MKSEREREGTLVNVRMRIVTALLYCAVILIHRELSLLNPLPMLYIPYSFVSLSYSFPSIPTIHNRKLANSSERGDVLIIRFAVRSQQMKKCWIDDQPLEGCSAGSRDDIATTR